MSEDEDVRTHLIKFYNAVDKLNAMNVEINEELLIIILLYIGWIHIFVRFLKAKMKQVFFIQRMNFNQ